jgi:Ser/Thr protein kinase RdoA (MazF antagonist)
MSWPTDHPALTDPKLAPWAGGIEEVVPYSRVKAVLRYLPGRRMATLVDSQGELTVVKVFASPRARGNVRRLNALAASRAAALVPKVIGSDATGHVLAVTYTRGLLPASLSDAQYPACFFAVGAALRRLHDSGTELDRVWDWEMEVTQLRRRAAPATADLAESLTTSSHGLAGGVLVPAHRDFHPRQVVVAEDGSVSFIDLDDAAMAPRGLDVGNMLGHLVKEAATGTRSEAATVQAGEKFLEGYGPCADLGQGVLTGWTLLCVARLAGLAESRHGDPVQRDALLAHCHGATASSGSVVRQFQM